MAEHAGPDPQTESRAATPPETARWRRGVGIMLLNGAGQVFVAQRIDFKSDAWQMPQGGLDHGEAPRDAAHRELEEETGIPPRLTRVIAQTPDWLRYELPADLRARLWDGRYRGQEQMWFLMRFLGCDEDITLDTDHPEFSAWQWVDPARVVDLIVPFKRDLYRAVLKTFAQPLADARTAAVS